ncbi:MAG TPA: amidohydrolase family protein [Terriglobales bacterium]|nr:amidohydrolase family protein [Terriglobales bacterium]
MRLARLLGYFVLASGLAALPAAAECPAGAFAIRGARVITVSGPTLPSATVVICQGVITAVGADVTAPPEAEVLDGHGLTVYPGLIDAYSQDGLPPAARPARPMPAAQPGGPQPLPPLDAIPVNSYRNYLDPPPGGVTPARRAADLIRPLGALAAVRATGITTALSAPLGGVLVGRAALIELRGPTAGDMIVNPDAGLVVELRPERGFGGGYPSSVMGAVAVFRQAFLDARRYQESEAIYRQAGERGLPRPVYDRQIVSLLPALNGQEPVIFIANDQDAILRALAAAAEFHLTPIIAGGAEAWKQTAALAAAHAPVLATLQFKPADADSLGPDERKKEEDENASNPAALAKAGIPFALTSQGLTAKDDFFAQVRDAMSHGLSADDALKATTLWPARILGAEAQLGSVDAGKIADLVVATGDPFAPAAQVKYLFIDGRLIFVHPEQRPHRPGARPGARPAETEAGR